MESGQERVVDFDMFDIGESHRSKFCAHMCGEDSSYSEC